jgi:hypothetical protein
MPTTQRSKSGITDRAGYAASCNDRGFAFSVLRGIGETSVVQQRGQGVESARKIQGVYLWTWSRGADS